MYFYLFNILKVFINNNQCLSALVNGIDNLLRIAIWFVVTTETDKLWLLNTATDCRRVLWFDNFDLVLAWSVVVGVLRRRGGDTSETKCFCSHKVNWLPNCNINHRKKSKRCLNINHFWLPNCNINHRQKSKRCLNINHFWLPKCNINHRQKSKRRLYKSLI